MCSPYRHHDSWLCIPGDRGLTRAVGLGKDVQ